MNKALRVMLACACGSLIGSLIAAEQGWYMLLGAIVGGAVSYLVVDLPAVLATLKEIIRKLDAEAKNASGQDDEQNDEPRTWKDLFECIAEYCWAALWQYLALAGTMISYIAGSIVLVAALTSNLNAGVWTLVVYASIGLAALIAIVELMYIITGEVDYFIEGNKRLLLKCNFFALTLYWPIRGIIWAVPRIPRALAFVATVIMNVLIEIHSGLRIQCLVDGAIGALIGGAHGSYLYGTIAGAFIGLINYLAFTRHVMNLDTHFDTIRL